MGGAVEPDHVFYMHSRSMLVDAPVDMSTDTRRYSTNTRPIIVRDSVATRSADISNECWSLISVECGRQHACRSSISRVSVVYRWCIGSVSVRLATSPTQKFRRTKKFRKTSEGLWKRLWIGGMSVVYRQYIDNFLGSNLIINSNFSSTSDVKNTILRLTGRRVCNSVTHEII